MATPGYGQNYAFEEIEVADASSLSRTVGGTAIGNFTEWYDVGVYSYVVPVLSTVFVPHSSLAQIGTFAGLTVSFLIRPIGGIFRGILGDRIGRKPVMYTGCILPIVVSVPIFLLILQGGYAAIFFGTLPMGLMLVCFMSTEPSTLPTLFPTSVRNGATSISFNLSVSAFGGTTPLIAAALVKGTDNMLLPAPDRRRRGRHHLGVLHPRAGR